MFYIAFTALLIFCYCCHCLINYYIYATSNIYLYITCDARIWIDICLYMTVWGLWCQKPIFQAGISNCIPQYSVECNYLSLPEIPASGTKVLISKRLCCNRYRHIFLKHGRFDKHSVGVRSMPCIQMQSFRRQVINHGVVNISDKKSKAESRVMYVAFLCPMCKTKWSPFCRWHFQMLFFMIMIIDSNCYGICSHGSNW